MSSWALYAVPILSVILAAGTLSVAIWRDRNKPELDEATVRELNNKLNARRDRRVVVLEDWADVMRQWVRDAQETFKEMCGVIREDRETLGKPMPDIHLPEPPKLPPPEL